jgi:hypothetical protein
MALAISAKSDSLYRVIGVELSGTEREQPNQTKIKARHYINELGRHFDVTGAAAEHADRSIRACIGRHAM